MLRNDDQHGHFHDNAQDVEHEHEHKHPKIGFHTHMHCHTKRAVLSLRKIASCAFFLGFAHEEEFALLALAVGGVSPLLLMSAYGLSVTASLIAITVLGMFERVKVKTTGTRSIFRKPRNPFIIAILCLT
jgi:hypothetical protein